MRNPAPDHHTPQEYPREGYSQPLSDLIDHAEQNAQRDPVRAREWRLLVYRLTGLIREERPS